MTDQMIIWFMGVVLGFCIGYLIGEAKGVIRE